MGGECAVTYITPTYRKAPEGLSQRQLKCLSLWRAGRDTLEIAEALYIPGHEAQRQLNRARVLERQSS
jgi:DNA-binding CsgD family transcriptional regulator